MCGHGRFFSRLAITRLRRGPSSVDQQRRAGGKFKASGVILRHNLTLGFNPLLLGVINIEEVIDVMPDRRGHKLRNITFHEFLDRIRHL
jgi:hypothetical protein